MQRCYDAERWTLEEAERENPPPLWLGLERWRREGATGEGYTLVLLHATGLQKEVSRHGYLGC